MFLSYGIIRRKIKNGQFGPFCRNPILLAYTPAACVLASNRRIADVNEGDKPKGLTPQGDSPLFASKDLNRRPLKAARSMESSFTTWVPIISCPSWLCRSCLRRSAGIWSLPMTPQGCTRWRRRPRTLLRVADF
jgi:hypothetical protein